MIPKKIHYCWFGGSPLPDIALNCIKSWRKYCPDYEIIQWNETNTDLESCQFVKQAFHEKKWAFISDYIRLKVVEEHGGIYLDIDVELIKSLDPFLVQEGFMGFEQAEPYCIATGLGFGAIAHHEVIKEIMRNYETTNFINEDDSFDTTPCPKRDSKVLEQLGLKRDNTRQNVHGIEIYPFEYFCPVSLVGDSYFTDNTVSIHHFNASWFSPRQKIKKNLIRLIKKLIGRGLYLKIKRRI